MPRPSRPAAAVPAADPRAAGGRRGRQGASVAAAEVAERAAAVGGRAPRGQAAARDPAPGRRSPWRLIRLAVVATIWGGLGCALILLWFARDLPRPEDALAPSRRPSLILRDSAGRVFARFGDTVGEPVRLADLPPTVAAGGGGYRGPALLDRTRHRPDRHRCAPPWSIWCTGRVVQGGSTITQQVAKNLFLSNARTLRRKAQELLLTLVARTAFQQAARSSRSG